MNKNLETMEITPYEEENKEIMESTECSKVGTGLAFIIGSGLTVAAIVGVKKLKKVWDNRKSKKEQSSDVIKVVESSDYEDFDSEYEEDEESE